MSKKLLVRPNPFPDESLVGYIIRLTEYNNYHSPNLVLSCVINSRISIFHHMSKIPEAFNKGNSKAIVGFAQMTQNDPTKIYNLARFSYFGTNLETSLDNLNPKIVYAYPHKFCPICINESNHHRKIWDLLIITVCPLHKCRLINRCPKCSNFLKMSRRYVCRCSCDFDFREAKPKYIPDAEIKIAGHVYSYLGFLTSNQNFISADSFLINYSLKLFSEIVYFFVKRVLKLKLGKALHYANLASCENLHEALCEVLTIFDNFPKNYLEFLEKIAKTKNFFGSERMYGYFSSYHPDFYKELPSNCSSILYKIFVENINNILLRSSRNLAHVDYPTSILDAELSSQLGLQTEEVVNLATNNIVSAKKKSVRRGKISYTFEGDTFLKIMTEVRSNKSLLSENNKTKLLNITQISQGLAGLDVKLNDFLSLVLKGNIKSFFEDLDAEGLHRFLFREKDVINLLKI